MSETGQIDLERAMGTMGAAQARLRKNATATHTLIAGASAEDGRLVCLIEAPALETVRRLVTLALLPAGRIREVIHLTRSPDAERPTG